MHVKGLVGHIGMRLVSTQLQQWVRTPAWFLRLLMHCSESAQVLDEIQAGVFDGMTYAQIEQTMPEEFAARKADKLGYR